MVTAAEHLPSFDDVTLRLCQSLVDGNLERARADFDAAVSAALSAEVLGGVWKQVTADKGAFSSMAIVTREVATPHETRTVQLLFHNGVVQVRVATDAVGKVAGLFLFAIEHPFVPLALAAGARQTNLTVGQPPFELPATFTAPAGAGPFPTVVLVHGSGPNDRDETVGANKPFRDLAWLLAARGIASLRYDKRTFVLKDKILPADALAMTVEDEVIIDALAAVRAARARPDVMAGKIFVVGHSLGAMLTPEIVERDRQVAGGVMLAPPSRPLVEIAVDQMTVPGAPAEQIEALRAQGARLAAGQVPPGEPILGATAGYLMDLERRGSPARARSLGRPLLLLWGERDYQVVEKDRQGWQQALHEVDKVSFRVFPGLNHLFLAGAQPSRPSEYIVPGTISADVVDAVAGFVQATAARR